MSPSTEKKVNVFPNLVVNESQLKLTLNDIAQSCGPKSSDGTGASFVLFNAATEFITDSKMQELNGSQMRFLSIQQHIQAAHYHLQIVLEKCFLEWACSIFPNVFLEIRATFRVASDTGSMSLLKRLGFHDILSAVEKRGKEELTQILFCGDVTRSGKMDFDNGQCTFSITIGWQQAKETIKINPDSIVQIVFKSEETKDLAIVAGNGAEIKCHKMIFAAQSGVLSKMVSSGMKEATTGVVELRENSEDGIKLLLQYLYGLGLDLHELSCDLAMELFKTAHKYELTHLENSLSELLLQKGIDWFTPNAILELHFYIRNINAASKLLEHSLHVMLIMDPQELRSSEGFQSLDHNAVGKLPFKLVEILQNGKKKNLAGDNAD